MYAIVLLGELNNAINNQDIHVYTTLLQQQFQLYKGDDRPDGIIGVIFVNEWRNI